MAHSFRTARERYQASWSIARDRSGRPVLPRVVQHPSRPGDVHPLDRKALIKLLPTVPLRFLHGLSRIEIRARESSDVGAPYGLYKPHYKLIRLYSTPFPDWPATPTAVIKPKSIFGICGVSIVERDGQFFFRWPTRTALARFYFVGVFAHELGHHHVYQYRHKRPLPGSLRGHEDKADDLMPRVRPWAGFRSVFGDEA